MRTCPCDRRPHHLARRQHVVDLPPAGVATQRSMRASSDDEACRRPPRRPRSSVVAHGDEPVAEHHPVEVRVAEGEAAVAPPLRHPVGHRVVGDRRLVEGDAEAAEALPPHLGQQRRRARRSACTRPGWTRRPRSARRRAVTAVAARARRGAGRPPPRAGRRIAGSGGRAHRLTMLHHGVIHNSVIQPQEHPMTVVENKWLAGPLRPDRR